MRVTQGYVSRSVGDFPFLEQMKLTEYLDSSRPLAVFGVYSNDDLQVIANHKSKVIIFWCGQDAIDCIFLGRYQFLKNCIHVSHLVNVVKALSPFLDVKLINPLSLGGDFKPTYLGKKVFAYAPMTYPAYHRRALINSLEEILPFEFIIGDGSMPQDEWLSGLGDETYNDCFIGLCLSGFAGGGQTILQLGLKGRKVITNVLLLPSCISWTNFDDIEKAILRESENIGIKNIALAHHVKSLIDNHSWLELDNYA